MFDQSFSAKNIEVVFNKENRKGHIDFSRMPQAYKDIVTDIHAFRAEMMAYNKKKKATWTDAEKSDYDLDKKLLDLLLKEKQQVLSAEFETVERQINNHGFSFTINVSDYGGKQYFSIDNGLWSQFYAMKLLQHNLVGLFNVEMVNRHSVMTSLKLLLNTQIPLYIIRSDITGFFESIPQQRLIRLVERNSLLGTKSKSMVKKVLLDYERIKDKRQVPAGQGVPRGIGISSPLSEIYMDRIDKIIKGRREVVFYARYVDDIFIILSSLGEVKDIKTYYGNLVTLFSNYGLTLQPGGSDKCKLIDKFSKAASSVVSEDLTYLGYHLYMEKKDTKMKTIFGLSDDRKTRIKKRIDNCFDHFDDLVKGNSRFARHDLLDGLNIVSGNIRLSKAKSGVKVGFFYNNDLLDKEDDFTELQNHLNGKVPTIPINLFDGAAERAKYESHLNKCLRGINFKDRWEKRKMFDIGVKRLKSIERWLQKGVK